MHLGTECWAFVALRCLDAGAASAKSGRWHNAAAHIRAVAGILDYLGMHVCAPFPPAHACLSAAADVLFDGSVPMQRHSQAMTVRCTSQVMMLCGMMLADYLPLKVEIEGTSGAGSIQVKRLRSSLASLLEPLTTAAVDRIHRMPASDEGCNQGGAEGMLMDSLMEVYRRPGDHPELTDYIKVNASLCPFPADP